MSSPVPGAARACLRPGRPLRRTLSLLLALGLTAVAAAKLEWEPIAPEDLAATECKSHPGAHAEGLLIRTILDSSGPDSWSNHYNQTKVYSLEGADDNGVLNIDYAEDMKVSQLAARVTKPDGTAQIFAESDFQDRTLSKLKGRKLKRKVLAVPGLAPGDVVDLQWTQGERSTVYSYQWWNARQRFPVRRCLFSVEQSPQDYKVLWFGVDAKQTSLGKHKMTLEMDDLPPYEEEPYSIPERDVRAWYLMLYTHPFMKWFSNDDVWDAISSYREEEFRLLTKPSSEIKKQARELVAGASTDEEKLARLYDFCRSTVSNFDYFNSQDIQTAKEEFDKRDDDPTPDWTLAHRVGYRRNVNQLFAALARGAGFDVRTALSASRDVTLQVRSATGWLFVDDDLVEVKLDGNWKPYAPGDYFLPAGMISSRYELADSFRCDGDKGTFVQNPVAPAALSVISRKGTFTLDADGNLEGDVTVELGGHPGAVRKSAWHGLSTKEIEDDFRETVTTRLPAATLENLSFVNSSGLTLPVTVTYHLKVPAYADLAGDKIIFAPAVFEHGSPAVFTAEKRETPIMFDYAWTERDDIEIQLPPGYTLDAATAPANVGDPAGIVGSRYVVGYKGKTRTLTYHRDFALGSNAATAFQAASYPALKELFDNINRSDEHTIVIKPRPTPAAAAPAPSTPPQT